MNDALSTTVEASIVVGAVSIAVSSAYIAWLTRDIVTAFKGYVAREVSGVASRTADLGRHITNVDDRLGAVESKLDATTMAAADVVLFDEIVDPVLEPPVVKRVRPSRAKPATAKPATAKPATAKKVPAKKAATPRKAAAK